MGYQRVIASNSHIIGDVKLREDFEIATDFIHLDAPPNTPRSNNQSIRYVCGIEENVIIPDNVKTGVEM